MVAVATSFLDFNVFSSLNGANSMALTGIILSDKVMESVTEFS